MSNLDKLRKAVEEEQPGNGAREIGEVVLMIAEESEQAAEIIAADIENESMSLAKSFTALRDYAKKHQQGGFWGCMCNRFDRENPVIQVICGFYHVPMDVFAQNSKRLGETEHAEPPETDGPVDLLDLL